MPRIEKPTSEVGPFVPPMTLRFGIAPCRRSIESMPPLLQTASLVSPVRYFMEIILGVFLKGAGWAELWPRVVILAIIGGVLFALSLIAFRRRVT